MGPAGKDGRKPVRARRVLAAAATKISSRLKWFFLRPQNADGERARTERRGEWRRSPPLRTRSPVRTRPGHRGERRPASPPVRALASVGNQTYQTILPSCQPAKSCEDCLEREADTRAPAASKQAVLASEGETAAARGRIQVILPRTESISNQYCKFARPK